MIDSPAVFTKKRNEGKREKTRHSSNTNGGNRASLAP